MATTLEDGLNSIKGFMGDLRNNWGWILALGILLLILGFIGIGMVGTMTLATTYYIGIIFSIAAIAQIFYAFAANNWKGVALTIIVGILYGIASYILLTDPVSGAASLTMVLGVALLVAGIFRAIVAFKLKPLSVWGWVLFSAILSIILGVLILMNWPNSSVYTLGTFMAVELISAGVSYIMLAFSAKSLPKTA